MSQASRRCVIAFGVFALCAGFFLAGCRRGVEPQADVSIAHEITPRPPRVGPATVTLRVADAAGRPVGGALISLEGNMSHAGMRPVFGTAKETGPGRYQ